MDLVLEQEVLIQLLLYQPVVGSGGGLHFVPENVCQLLLVLQLKRQLELLVLNLFLLRNLVFNMHLLRLNYLVEVGYNLQVIRARGPQVEIVHQLLVLLLQLLIPGRAALHELLVEAKFLVCELVVALPLLLEFFLNLHKIQAHPGKRRGMGRRYVVKEQELRKGNRNHCAGAPARSDAVEAK